MKLSDFKELAELIHNQTLNAVWQGTEITKQALYDQGKLYDSRGKAAEAKKDDEPWIVDEFADQPEAPEVVEESPLPDILLARSRKFAEQAGKVEVEKVTEELKGDV